MLRPLILVLVLSEAVRVIDRKRATNAAEQPALQGHRYEHELDKGPIPIPKHYSPQKFANARTVSGKKHRLNASNKVGNRYSLIELPPIFAVNKLLLKTPLHFSAVSILAVCLLAGSSTSGEQLSHWSSRVLPMIETYCVKCHTADEAKGGVILEDIKSVQDVFDDIELMADIRDVVEFEEMPPRKAKQPSQRDREQAIAWLNYLLTEGVNEIGADPGPSVIRRLTREEYSRTVRDLFFIEFDVSEAVGMPSDSIQEGFSFDNLAGVLDIQPLLMEKYFDAAVEVVDRYFYESQIGRRVVANIESSIERALYPQQKRVVAANSFRGLLSRMFRRPVTDEELTRYVELYDEAMRQDVSVKEAFRHMIIAALMSPNFLYRIEEDRGEQFSGGSYPVTDFELATRLSYFLWSTMPDNELLRLAHLGELSSPDIYDQQVRRMLADPRARALAEVFAAQWMEVDHLAEARPSQDFFPDFTQELKDAMYQEPIHFFDYLRTNNGKLTDLLDSNYTFANQTLAEFYGIEGVTGEGFEKVRLRREMNRGGVLGMGAFLAMNSHVFRTSPTLRGKWVLSVVLGSPPPPPPANASQIATEVSDDKSLDTFRDVLAAHANDASCAGCHRKIDPIGFALDNFDPIGRWRSTVGEELVDTSGELPNGDKVKGFDDLKRILNGRRDDFLEHVTKQMMRYALGRHLIAADKAEVNRIVGVVRADDYRLNTLITEVAKSYPFMHRKDFVPEEPGVEVAEHLQN